MFQYYSHAIIKPKEILLQACPQLTNIIRQQKYTKGRPARYIKATGTAKFMHRTTFCMHARATSFWAIQ